jgi:hypothetical protein
MAVPDVQTSREHGVVFRRVQAQLCRTGGGGADDDARGAVSVMNERVFICVVSGIRTTSWEFSRALHGVAARTGASLIWEPASGGSLDYVRNRVIKRALDAGAHWIWCLDDDHDFPPDTLERLLQHRADIVCPLVSRRFPPFAPFLFSPAHPIDASMSDEELINTLKVNTPDPEYVRGKRGLVDVHVCGAGGMLVAAKVFQRTPFPWFRFGKVEIHGGEDTWFSMCARRSGFKIWCDLDTPIAHLSSCAIWPTREPDGSIGAEAHLVPGGALKWIGKIDGGKRVDYQSTRSDADAVTLAR